MFLATGELECKHSKGVKSLSHSPWPIVMKINTYLAYCLQWELFDETQYNHSIVSLQIEIHWLWVLAWARILIVF